MGSEIVKFDFHGDALDVVRNDVGEVFVSVRRVCEALGVMLNGQLQKLKGKRWAVMQFICTTGPDGKSYEAACISLRALPQWLNSIEPSRVAPHVRPKLELYQDECADVLADHFLGKRGMSAEMVALAQALPMVLAQLAEAKAATDALSAKYDEQAIELAAVKAMATADGCIGEAVAESHIKRPLRMLASIQCAAKGLTGRRAMASERGKAESALRADVGHHARAWSMLSRGAMAAATNRLEVMRKAALSAVSDAAQMRQGTLFGAH